MLCPHKAKYLNPQLLESILEQTQPVETSCALCAQQQIVCIGCLQGACDKHLHSCSPIIYIPSENILFCRQCNCELLSLHMSSDVERKICCLLHDKYIDKRHYELNSWEGYDFLVAKQQICDFGQTYDCNAENILWDEDAEEEGDENGRLDAEITASEAEFEKLQQEVAQLTSDVMTAEKKKEHKAQKNARLAAVLTPTPEQNDTPRTRRRREKSGEDDSEVETSSISERKRKRTHL